MQAATPQSRGSSCRNRSRLPALGGALRYDGNVAEHGYVVCDGCGEIQEADLGPRRGLEVRAGRRHRADVRRCRIDFYGLCARCADREKPVSQAFESGGEESHG